MPARQALPMGIQGGSHPQQVWHPLVEDQAQVHVERAVGLVLHGLHHGEEADLRSGLRDPLQHAGQRHADRQVGKACPQGRVHERLGSGLHLLQDSLHLVRAPQHVLYAAEVPRAGGGAADAVHRPRPWFWKSDLVHCGWPKVVAVWAGRPNTN